MHALILAAGLGTRLGGLSAERPKPLLPVCDQPLVRWAVRCCAYWGIHDVAVNLHHLGEQIRGELDTGAENTGAEISTRICYSPEREILGTGGGIRAMAALMPRQTCVVLNGKIVCDVDLDAVLALHRRRRALATVVIHPVADAERWGALGADATGGLVRLLDRRRGDPVAREGMFTGIHVLEPEFIDAIPEGPCCVIRTAYSALFARGAPLAAYVHEGYFHEHSTPARYLQGNVNLLDAIAAPPGGPPLHRGVHPLASVDPRAEIEEPLLVAAGATVGAGARVGPHVVLGARSVVAAGVRVRRSVIWPDAAVTEDCASCIVTPRGVTQVVP